MSEAMKFFDNFAEKMSKGINTCMLCKIEEYDHEAMKAKVTPMVKVKYGDEETEQQELLIEIPVSHLKAGPFIIRPPYKPGDIVLVVFADRDIENVLLSGNKEDPNSTRKHSIDDAIIVQGIMPYINTLPGEHKDDLIIARDDFTTKIVLTEEHGDIIIKADRDVNIEAKRDITLKAKRDIILEADRNIHRRAGVHISDDAPVIDHN